MRAVLAVLARGDTGQIYLSAGAIFSVRRVPGVDEDVVVFTPSSTGPATSGIYDSALFFDGSALGLQRSDLAAFSLP